jgi:hypothetical protein
MQVNAGNAFARDCNAEDGRGDMIFDEKRKEQRSLIRRRLSLGFLAAAGG